MTEISKNIRKYRRQQGLSQEELAAKLNVTRQTVSTWERAKSYPDLDMVVALSDALDTDPNSLLYPPVGETKLELRGVSPKPILITLVVFYLLVTRGGLMGEWWLPFGSNSVSPAVSWLVPIYCGIVALAVLVVGCTTVLLEELRGQGGDAPPRTPKPAKDDKAKND